jgi:hypothetical protein
LCLSQFGLILRALFAQQLHPSVNAQYDLVAALERGDLSGRQKLRKCLALGHVAVDLL